MKRNTRKASKRGKAIKQPSAKRTRPASQTTQTKKSAPTQPPTKSYILLGADEYAKPRAARFSGEDPALLAKAAEAMHLRLVEITEPDVAEIAALLPAGRLQRQRQRSRALRQGRRLQRADVRRAADVTTAEQC
jgi:hypothetical protein